MHWQSKYTSHRSQILLRPVCLLHLLKLALCIREHLTQIEPHFLHLEERIPLTVHLFPVPSIQPVMVLL